MLKPADCRDAPVGRLPDTGARKPVYSHSGRLRDGPPGRLYFL